MKLKLILIVALISHCSVSFSQGDSSRTRSFDHYFSIQSNQLLRQILNFGGSAQGVSNPYFLSYSFNHRNSGWGMNTGFGYEYDHFSEDIEDQKRITDIDDLSFRIGVDKKNFFGERWMLGWGVDVLSRYSVNKTTNRFVSDIRRTEVSKTKNYIASVGGGPRLNFAFVINDWILLSTEASYYFVKSETVSKFRSYSIVTDSSGNNEVQNDNTQKDRSRRGSLDLELPVVINLTFRI